MGDKGFDSNVKELSPKPVLGENGSVNPNVCNKPNNFMACIIPNSATLDEAENGTLTPNMSNLSGSNRNASDEIAENPSDENSKTEVFTMSRKISNFTPKMLCGHDSTNTPVSCRDSSPVTAVTPTR